ncbi:MAG: DUF3426 domain-containing protein [Pseudomonadota bacterium]
MILTCPSCQSRFNVPDGSLGAGGRRVRCGDCRHVWHAMPEPAVTPTPEAAPEAEARGSEAPFSEAAGPRRDESDVGPVSDASAWAPRPGTDRDRKPVRRGLLLGWGLLVIVILGLAAAGWFAREEVVASVPEARPLYEKLGLPLAAQEPQLVVHDVVSLRRTVDGQEKLQVQGVVTNEGVREVAVPEMRAVINDTGGQELHSWTFQPEETQLAPGNSTEFSTATDDPPDEGSLSLIFLEQD